jgi:hypothetical protein
MSRTETDTERITGNMGGTHHRQETDAQPPSTHIYNTLVGLNKLTLGTVGWNADIKKVQILLNASRPHRLPPKQLHRHPLQQPISGNMCGTRHRQGTGTEPHPTCIYNTLVGLNKLTLGTVGWALSIKKRPNLTERSLDRDSHSVVDCGCLGASYEGLRSCFG